MPRCLAHFRDKEKGRAYRNRANNYARGRQHARSGGNPWSQADVEFILNFSGTDRELAALIGRSVEAIQIKRSRIRAKQPKKCRGTFVLRSQTDAAACSELHGMPYKVGDTACCAEEFVCIARQPQEAIPASAMNRGGCPFLLLWTTALLVEEKRA